MLPGLSAKSIIQLQFYSVTAWFKNSLLALRRAARNLSALDL
jgi:hypothetical protein